MFGLLLLIASVIAGLVVMVQADAKHKHWGLLPIGLAVFAQFLMPSLLAEAGMSLDAIVVIALSTTGLSTAIGFFLYNKTRVEYAVRQAGVFQE